MWTLSVLFLAQSDFVSWEKLSGVSGGVVLGLIVWAFLGDKIRPTATVKAELETWKQLYREAVEDGARWEKRADDTTALLRKSVEINESLKNQVAELRQQVNDLATVVKKGA